MHLYLMRHGQSHVNLTDLTATHRDDPLTNIERSCPESAPPYIAESDPHLEQGEPLNRLCEHFIESIRNGTEPESGGAGGLEVVRILEACTESLRTRGGPVSFPGSCVPPLPLPHEPMLRAI